MIQTICHPPSWSPSGCYLAESAETKVAAYRIHFMLTELTDSNLQCQKSWALLHCHSPDRLSSKILANYIFFLTAVSRDTEPASTWNLSTSSTCWSAQPRLWEKHSSRLHNPKLPVQFWLSRSRGKLLWNYPTSHYLISDSEIVLKMIPRNDPAGLPMFYGTRVMELSALSAADNWNWCPGSLNPADLLTRPGATLEKINSKFWLQGSFLPPGQPNRLPL